MNCSVEPCQLDIEVLPEGSLGWEIQVFVFSGITYSLSGYPSKLVCLSVFLFVFCFSNQERPEPKSLNCFFLLGKLKD